MKRLVRVYTRHDGIILFSVHANSEFWNFRSNKACIGLGKFCACKHSYIVYMHVYMLAFLHACKTMYIAAVHLKMTRIRSRWKTAGCHVAAKTWSDQRNNEWEHNLKAVTYAAV